MGTHMSPVVRSRRYGVARNDGVESRGLYRNPVDNLSSSVAEPPPDVFAPGSKTKSRTLLTALQKMTPHDMFSAADDPDDDWTDSEPDTGVPHVAAMSTHFPDAHAHSRDTRDTHGLSERSFLSEYQRRNYDSQTLVDDVQDAYPTPIRRVPLPTVSDEQDVDAPKTVPSAPRVRTAMQEAMSGESKHVPVEEEEEEVPVVHATASAMERLVDSSPEEPIPPVHDRVTQEQPEHEHRHQHLMHRKKGKSTDAAHGLGSDGEAMKKKKKKKKDQDGDKREPSRRRKKRFDDTVAHDLEPESAVQDDPLYDPLIDPMPPATMLINAERFDLDADQNNTTAAHRVREDLEVAARTKQEEVAASAPLFTITPPKPTVARAGTAAAPGQNKAMKNGAHHPAPSSPTHSLALTERTRHVSPAKGMAATNPALKRERARMHVFNYNATRLAVNVYILYWGMFATLRRLWRWENPWVTAGIAALYLVIWWRGDLLAVFFLAAFLYVATFRIWQMPAMGGEQERSAASMPASANTSTQAGASFSHPSESSAQAITRRGTEALGLVTLAPSRETLQQVGDQVLVVAHGLADMHERLKNLMLWRSPLITLRYLGWLLLFALLSMQATTWMLMRLPGALVFVLLFILAPIVEYGHLHRLLHVLSELSGAPPPDPKMPHAATRTVLDSVLAGVPTDEEYLHEKLVRTHWEAERELRRLGEWVDSNRIVEEQDDDVSLSRRKTKGKNHHHVPRVSKQMWSDANADDLPTQSKEFGAHTRGHAHGPSSEYDLPFSSTSPVAPSTMRRHLRDSSRSDGLLSDERNRLLEVESMSDYGSQAGMMTTMEADTEPATTWKEGTQFRHRATKPTIDAAADTPFPPNLPRNTPRANGMNGNQSLLFATPVTDSDLPTPQARSVNVENSALRNGTNSIDADGGLDAGPSSANGPAAEPQDLERASHAPAAAPLPTLTSAKAAVPPAQAASVAPVQPATDTIPTGDIASFSHASSAGVGSVPTSNHPGNTSGPTLLPSQMSKTHSDSSQNSSFPVLNRPNTPFIPARSESLQTYENERQQRLKNWAMSPPVPTEIMNLVSSPTVASRPLSSLTRDLDMGHGLHLAVFRKRLGHLIVLPTRVVFLLSYTPHRLPETAQGLTSDEEDELTHAVDGRLFYPMMSPTLIKDMVELEMDGQGLTDFQIASVPLARVPKQNDILFEVPVSQITGLKKLRKSTPILENCTEGLEIVLSESEKGLSLPAVIDRDLAFQRILTLDPQRWAA